MTGMQFENKVTIGNVLTMLAMIAGMFWSYSQLQQEQARQADKIESINGTLRDRVALVDARNAAFETRMRAVEVAQASQSSDLQNILSAVNEIKAALAVRGAKP